MELVELAKHSLELPSDYWTGYDDEGVTWGRTVFTQTRDSDYRAKAIYAGAWKELSERYPDDVRDHHFSHWAFGYGQQIHVRVLTRELNEDEEITEDLLTEAFKWIMETFDPLDHSWETDWFESDISEAEYEETLNNIKYEASGMCDMSEDDAEKKVFSWLWDECIYAGGDDGTWFSEDEVVLACYHLNMMDLEWDAEAWRDWEDAHPDEVQKKIQKRIAENNTPLPMEG